MIAYNGACETDFLTELRTITLKIMLRYNNKQERGLREQNLEKNVGKKYLKIKILMTKIYNTMNQVDNILALLVVLDRNWEKDT